MPVNFEIDATQSLVLTTVTGTVDAAEMTAYQAAVAADPRFSPQFDILMEFREGSMFDGTGEDIKRLAQTSPFKLNGRRAYVGSNDLHFGMSRMAQEYADLVGAQAAVFRDRVAALAWLGHTPTNG